MEFSEVVRRRRIVRHFRPDPVPPETLDRILDLARHAPTAGFTQGYAFVVVTRPDLRQAVGRISGEPADEAVPEGALFHRFVSEAPVQIIACTSEAAGGRCSGGTSSATGILVAVAAVAVALAPIATAFYLGRRLRRIEAEGSVAAAA